MKSKVNVLVKLLVLRDDTLLFGILNQEGKKVSGLPSFYPDAEKDFFKSLDTEIDSLFGVEIERFTYGPSFFHTSDNQTELVSSIIIWIDSDSSPLTNDVFEEWKWVRPSLWKTKEWNEKFVFPDIEAKIFKKFDFSPHRWSGLMEKDRTYE